MTRDRDAEAVAKWPIGRPLKPVPEGAAKLVRSLAADGWSKIGIAEKLGVTDKTFARWLEDNEDLREAFLRGREHERHTLHNVLYRQAVEGTGRDAAFAALALLNSRHGYRSETGDQDGRVHVTVNLPGALSHEDYIKSLEKVSGKRTETIDLSTPRA